MTDPHKHLMDAITLRGGGQHDLDTVCNSVSRLVARVEAFRDAGAHDSQGIALEMLGEKLAELAEMSVAFQAAQAGAAA